MQLAFLFILSFFPSSRHARNWQRHLVLALLASCRYSSLLQQRKVSNNRHKSLIRPKHPRRRQRGRGQQQQTTTSTDEKKRCFVFLFFLLLLMWHLVWPKLVVAVAVLCTLQRVFQSSSMSSYGTNFLLLLLLLREELEPHQPPGKPRKYSRLAKLDL